MSENTNTQLANLGTSERYFQSIDGLISILPDDDPERIVLVREKLNMAKLAMLVNSPNVSCIPDYYKGNFQNAMYAVEYGRNLGLNMQQSLQSVFIVSGKCSVFGDAMSAIAMKNPDYVDTKIEFSEEIVVMKTTINRKDWVVKGNGKSVNEWKAHELNINLPKSVTVTVYRKDREPFPSTFTTDDVALNLNWRSTKDGPWKTNPKQMMINRARAFATRGAFPDSLSGIYDVDELRDVGPIIEMEQKSSGEFSSSASKETPVFKHSKEMPPDPKDAFKKEEVKKAPVEATFETESVDEDSKKVPIKEDLKPEEAQPAKKEGVETKTPSSFEERMETETPIGEPVETVIQGNPESGETQEAPEEIDLDDLFERKKGDVKALIKKVAEVRVQNEFAGKFNDISRNKKFDLEDKIKAMDRLLGEVSTNLVKNK